MATPPSSCRGSALAVQRGRYPPLPARAVCAIHATPGGDLRAVRFANHSQDVHCPFVHNTPCIILLPRSRPLSFAHLPLSVERRPACLIGQDPGVHVVDLRRRSLTSAKWREVTAGPGRHNLLHAATRNSLLGIMLSSNRWGNREGGKARTARCRWPLGPGSVSFHASPPRKGNQVRLRLVSELVEHITFPPRWEISWSLRGGST